MRERAQGFLTRRTAAICMAASSKFSLGHTRLTMPSFLASSAEIMVPNMLKSFTCFGPMNLNSGSAYSQPKPILMGGAPNLASSEAMTHGAIYALGDAIGSVVHAHSRELWEACLGKIPTTDPDVAYGTPAMAMELDRLYRMGGFKEAGIAVLAGHEDGLISFGTTIEEIMMIT